MVKSTWKQVLPISEQAAALFYGKLFEIKPEFKDLFKSDMKSQGRKLMTMINTAVNNVDQLEKIIPALQDLGKRHVNYGVKADDYNVVAEALLWTLGQGLGDAFTDDAKEAWTNTYTALAGVMLKAAEEVEFA